ncbi:Multicopper oxidase with three cupredoxin domains (includes cell division protein FtsP and spore coat protein CotA) [Prosthecobacter debontii]|uniref:Multicopper oxidase with three cupredoxin domains (Includes cell division protein FtsP and spore coat protein CotA) n=1 Tax=Prosthecobacter debontii TaxID=48467 RepID=A0A1T4YCK1_9BACT|nr:multicopper oxidase domain-containing protein [Prosthecobacter debontii]SKA99562.1 Multicopper oxidase with three cupredoxin domains (includes cell division protein FtsP and spore coat protein CotA) [Prosthecobacter debontii]
MKHLLLSALWLPVAALACDDCKLKAARTPTGPLVEYDLYIAAQTVSPAGKPVRGLTINGGIPGPTLRFHEGDFARIRVHNQLKDEETSTHWHGLLLPNEMDGVPHVTTAPIRPGQTHVFEFELKHSGTYWYHSHTHLQEQSGVYGSIVVTPRGGEPAQADREQVLLFSDWTNINPHEVQRMLMRGTDYFGLMRSNSQSILGAAQQGMLKDYFSREWSRMMPMDVSDVGYHAFLVNGQRQTEITGRPGERVRLRLINASAATYFYLQSSTGPLTIVAADGPPVQPVKVDRLFMAIAETYDVIITIPREGRYELRATTQDGSGRVSAFMGSGELHAATDPPRPNLYQMDEMLNLALEEQEDDPRASLRLPRPGSPYRVLKATHDTTLPAKLPRRKITLRLTGDMNRYIWSFNGKTVTEEPYIPIKKGEVIELELVNDTMMHHPIHLHGHFFRLLMGQGARSPLKHTVDVPPMSKRIVEFEANEEKDWMFHCHILYHMMSGMARVFRYEDTGSDAGTLARKVQTAQDHGIANDHRLATAASGHANHQGGGLGEHAHDMAYVWGSASLQSHMSEGLLTWMNPKNDLLLGWEVGWVGVDKTQYEIDALYQRYFNPNFQAFAGARFTNDPDAEDRAVIGFNYRLPLMAWATLSLDSEGDARITLAKRFQLTPRLGVFGRVEYDTGTRWEWTAGADYTLTRHTSLITQYHSEFGLGAGVLIRF